MIAKLKSFIQHIVKYHYLVASARRSSEAQIATAAFASSMTLPMVMNP
jgi:hypothetical protein